MTSIIIDNLKIKADKGQLLIESMVAIGIVVAGFLGVLGFFSRSISLNRVVNDHFIANYLAVEGIEIVKNLIDANDIQERPFNVGLSDGDYELDYTTTFQGDTFPLSPFAERKLRFNESTGFYNYTFGRETPFIRMVRIRNIDADSTPGAEQIVVNSIVKWKTRGGGQFEVNLEDHFFDW